MNEEYEYDDEEVEYYAIRPNKTQIKKDMAALFAVSEEMSELSAGQLKTLELPEVINKAVVEVSGMPHKGARKRLLKFIAGQLHKIDVEPILEKLARIKNKSAHAVREHHTAERWRDRLISDGNDALTELLDEQPHADRQLLRQLLRNAQKEAEAGKPPKSSRLLYRQLKALFQVEGEVEEEPDDDAEFDDEEEFD
ncbi:MAG: ribosome biogenesis factor YjgA [Methylobacter sp.]